MCESIQKPNIAKRLFSVAAGTLHCSLLRCRLAFLVMCLWIVSLSCVTSSSWANFEEGEAAYDRKDYATALRVFRPLAEQGHANAQYNLGRMYAQGHGLREDDVEAVKWYRKAAEQGHAGAQISLGVMYTSDRSNIPKNVVEAAKWYHKAAEQGDAFAQLSLGNMYRNGEGVPKDGSKALKWYRRLAEHGDALAQLAYYVIGNMYRNGEGVPKDGNKAVEWYRRAAEHGGREAQNSLGYMYENGEGVPKNYIAAYKWYAVASENGHDAATENRDRVSKKIDITEQIVADLWVNEWKPVDVRQNIPRTKVENQRAIAVIIGNRDYTKPGVPHVKYAEDDAYIVKEYLIHTLGYSEENIHYHIDATKGVFEEIFGNETTHKGRLFDYVEADGTSDIFIYYSGHGAPDLKSYERYLVPVDADPSKVKLGGYPLKLLYRNLKRIPYRSATVVIDSCFSGMSASGELIPGIKGYNIPPVNIPLLPPEKSVIFTATNERQVANGYSDKQHSLFTYFFLKALRGEADASGDNQLTVSEIVAYIDQHVPRMSRRIHGSSREQTPQVDGNGGLVIVRY